MSLRHSIIYQLRQRVYLYFFFTLLMLIQLILLPVQKCIYILNFERIERDEFDSGIHKYSDKLLTIFILHSWFNILKELW